jgi:hypothetical protein
VVERQQWAYSVENSLLYLQTFRKQKTLLISSRYPCKYWINFRKPEYYSVKIDQKAQYWSFSTE